MTHPDSDVLAEFRAGLVAGRRRARIASHLAACERCTGLSDQLSEISALLAAVPAPAMPDAVAQRLESVLAAEAAQRNHAERPAGDGAPAGRPPRRGWDFRLVALRVLAPAAGVVLLAAGGYGLSRIGERPTNSVAAGSEAAPAVSSAPAAALPSSAASSGTGVAPAFEGQARLGVVISPVNYLHATLQQQLTGELARYARGAAGPQALATAAIKGCVLRVTAGIHPGTPVLVEKARYQGRPAVVIVVVSGHGDAAWVTTPGCSASSDHILATTMLPGTSAP